MNGNNYCRSGLSHLNKFFVICFASLMLYSCAPSTKFTSEKEAAEYIEKNPVRVLLNDDSNELILTVNTPVYLFIGDKRLALVNKGNKIRFTAAGRGVTASIGNRNYSGKEIRLEQKDKSSLIRLNYASYRGSIRVVNEYGFVRLINSLSLEDYIKGVMTKEMPVGKGNENYEALKAFAICVRTYTIMKMGERKEYFDVYADVKDQVYGGADSEHKLATKAVEETDGMILTYSGVPAVCFYHSTCGGFTENVVNVFNHSNGPYLNGVKDGELSYCSISPRFQWEESYSDTEFIRRLKNADLLNPETNYSLQKIEVVSRFNSGRVNELKIEVKSSQNSTETLSLFSNRIRSVIKNSDNNGILRSTMFDVNFSAGKIIITGKGFGHGVGLCQYGAIRQSNLGKTYTDILSHYFPGTKISKLYD